MTERKPGGMSFQSWVDAQIEAAQGRGEFDNLPGKGKPIKSIDGSHDEMWWVKQWLVREGVSYLPPVLALRLEVEKTLDGIGNFSTAEAVRSAIEDLNARIRESNRKPALDGPPSTLMPMDVDAVVERWRQSRSDPT